MTARSMTPAELVQWGIACGLVHPRPAMPPVDKHDHGEYVATVRQSNRQEGKTYNGKPRKNRQWPQLKGLVGKEYHNAYIKLYRLTHDRKDGCQRSGT